VRERPFRREVFEVEEKIIFSGRNREVVCGFHRA